MATAGTTKATDAEIIAPVSGWDIWQEHIYLTVREQAEQHQWFVWWLAFVQATHRDRHTIEFIWSASDLTFARRGTLWEERC